MDLKRQEILLERILKGWIHVCKDTLDIHFYVPSRKRFEKKKLSYHNDRARVSFNLDGRTVTIYRHCLVWLYFKRQVVETVDHIDGDKTNDHPTNLQPHSLKESREQGNSRQQDKHYEECRDFFDFIQVMGYAPNW